MEPTIQPLQKWLSGRKETITELRKLADDLDRKYKTCNKVGIAGATLGVVAAGTAAVGAIAAAPMTGGASLVAGTGIIMGLGTRVADKIIADSAIKKMQELFDEDCKRSKEVRDAMTRLCEVEIGIYQQLSIHIQENVQCGGTKMPPMQRSKYKRTNLHGNYKVGDLFKAAVGECDLLKIPVVREGLKMLQKGNIEDVQKLMHMGMDCLGNADQRAFLLKEVAKAARQLGFSGLLTPQSVSRLLGYGRYFGLISSAALPFQLKDLIDKATAVREGAEHKVSRCIRQKADTMKVETKEIEDHIKHIVTDLSNMVLLINLIKRKGCDESLDTLLNMILKEINKAKHLTDVLNKLNLHNNEEDCDLDEDNRFEAITVNCEGVTGWPVKELSLWLWCAWKLRCGSVIFLQNTHFTHVPSLWTLFGVSINCFGGETSCGVSLLLPKDYCGYVESNYEFKDEIDPNSSWNGRCMVVNVQYNSKQFSLINIIAPGEKTDRELFIKEVTKFIKRNATAPQRLIASVDFASEIPTMTLEVPKKASISTPLSIAMKFIPTQPVSQYLFESTLKHKRDRDTIAAETYVDDICDSLNLTMPGRINWFHCSEPTLTHDKFNEQIQIFLNVGLTDLWTRKNLDGNVEFSTVKRVGSRTVTATRAVHFCVSEKLCDNIKVCEFDHFPRILGFADHSALTFVYID